MAGGENSEQKFTGFTKYYNSVTPQGRVNVAASTLIGAALVGIYFYVKAKSKKSAEKK